MPHENNDALAKLVYNVTVASSLRIPELNASDPEMCGSRLWGVFFEGACHDDHQRYLDVMSSLTPRMAGEVRDVIMRPHDNDSYTTLRRELIKRLCSTQEEKTHKLLENVVMEDEKPSQYLRRLQALAGSAVPEDLLRTLWMRGLPEKLKPTMATQTGKTLPDMAEVADSVYRLLPARPSIHEVALEASLHSQIQQLIHELSALKTQMAAVLNQVQEVSSGSEGWPRQPPRLRS